MNAGAWARELRRYRQASAARGMFELAVTAIPLAAACYLMSWSLGADNYLLYALLLVPGAAMLVRLFMIQHDCGHGAFFPSQRANDWVGRVIGVATLTPYYHWRRSHAFHHANAGNLDRRGIGDVRTLTVAEYSSRSRWGRMLYRLYRHPAVMFGLGPAYLFVFQNRLPFGFTREGWRPWLSTLGTTGVVACVVASAAWAGGLGALLWIYVPLVLLAAAAGVWLFYVQHQFERTYWAEGNNWNAREAALFGSSYYLLPKVLQWLTANIGVHHVHHLSNRIPFYRLAEVLNDHAALRLIGRVTTRDSLRGVRLTLWDADCRRLISFTELARRDIE